MMTAPNLVDPVGLLGEALAEASEGSDAHAALIGSGDRMHFTPLGLRLTELLELHHGPDDLAR